VQPLSLAELTGILGGVPVGDLDESAVAEHPAIHSDRIRSRSVFFALPGSRTDGHRHVADALANGALAAVVARGRGADVGGACIEVDDPLAALQRLAGWWRRRITGAVVAVVGSNGKTVTKDALVAFAGAAGPVYGSPGSYNSQLGVALAVLDCPADVHLAVIEAAVSEPGEMRNLASFVAPDHVVLTNLGTRWASRFGNRSEQAAELLSMADRLGPDGWLLIGEDDPSLAGGPAPGEGRRVVCGRDPATPRFGAPVARRDGFAVAVTFPGGRGGELVVRTPSEEILSDVTTAFVAAWLVGTGEDELLEAAGGYVPTSTRTEIWRSPTGVTVVRDVVTPDPIAVRSAARAARRLCGPGHRLTAVLAEPIEWVDDDAVAAFAHALAGEGVSAIYGLRHRSHDALAGLGETDRAVPPVRLVSGTAELRSTLLRELAPGDVVLVQSAPTAAISDLAVALMESMAPTRLYLDLAAIEDNVRAFRRHLRPGVRIMGMVKALAYGTDAPNISACLQASGVDALGVSGVDEGIALRRAGVTVPILVMLGTAAEVPKMLRYRLTPLVYSPELLGAVLAEGGRSGAEIPVHVEVDSGMHRTGFEPAGALDALERLAASPGVRVDGLMTHLACADDPAEDAATAEQLRRFRAVSDALGRFGLGGVLRHAAATAAAIRFPDAQFDMVRLGLGLYGVYPGTGMAETVALTPAVGMVSRVVEVVEVPAGERVGYGGTYTAPAGGARVGVVPAGHHDGVPRAASNAGAVLVGGVRCPIVGRVSMDSMAVDLSACPNAEVGVDVLLYGAHHEWSLPVEDFAEAAGTIPHELMARIGPRVQRIFTRH
jgi:alanine racemase